MRSYTIDQSNQTVPQSPIGKCKKGLPIPICAATRKPVFYRKTARKNPHARWCDARGTLPRCAGCQAIVCNNSPANQSGIETIRRSRIRDRAASVGLKMITMKRINQRKPMTTVKCVDEKRDISRAINRELQLRDSLPGAKVKERHWVQPRLKPTVDWKKIAVHRVRQTGGMIYSVVISGQNHRSGFPRIRARKKYHRRPVGRGQMKGVGSRMRNINIPMEGHQHVPQCRGIFICMYTQKGGCRGVGRGRAEIKMGFRKSAMEYGRPRRGALDQPNENSQCPSRGVGLYRQRVNPNGQALHPLGVRDSGSL